MGLTDRSLSPAEPEALGRQLGTLDEGDGRIGGRMRDGERLILIVVVLELRTQTVRFQLWPAHGRDDGEF